MERKRKRKCVWVSGRETEREPIVVCGMKVDMSLRKSTRLFFNSLIYMSSLFPEFHVSFLHCRFFLDIGVCVCHSLSHAPTHTHTHINTLSLSHTHAHTCAHTHIHTHTYTHTHAHTHKLAHTHTHIHTHTRHRYTCT
jgi:hypothetical protein